MNNLEQAFDAVTSDDFDEWRVDDQPYVRGENFSDLDSMLAEFGRRVKKNGRLDEYEQNQHFTKPSKRKRNEREAQAHRAETGRSRDRWRGGVQD